MEPREKYVNVFFTREKLTSNEDGKKFYRDIKNSMDTAFEEGKEEGQEEGKVEGKEEGLKQGELKGLKKGRIEGLKEGRIEGLNLGKKTMIVEIIQNGVSNNMSVEILTQLTGLNEKEALDIISTL